MEKQAYIDKLVKRVEWVEEDMGTIAGDAAGAVLTVVPVIRDAFPHQAIKLLESFSKAFGQDIDEAIEENERETAEM